MYQNLDAWKKAYRLGIEVYKRTKDFPKEEIFGITSQMRRAATSIPVNIAEGSSRGTIKEFRQYISVARGSAAELETWLMYARDLYYLCEADYQNLFTLLDDIKALLYTLYKSPNLKLS